MVRWADGLEPTPPNLTLRRPSRRRRRHADRDVPIPHRAVPGAARQGLGGPRLHGNAGRLAVAERAIEVLGRRSARGVQELGGDHEPAQPAQRHRREHPAPRAAAPGRDESDLGQQARLADPAAHARCRPARSAWRRSRTLNNRQISYPFGPNAGITEILIPAGYVRTAYDPNVRAHDRRQWPQGLPRHHRHDARRRFRRPACRSRSISWSSREWSTWR